MKVIWGLKPTLSGKTARYIFWTLIVSFVLLLLALLALGSTMVMIFQLRQVFRSCSLQFQGTRLRCFVSSSNGTEVATRTEPKYFDKFFTFPPDQPAGFLNATVAFSKLSSKEKLYAHHLSKASYYGGLIAMLQLSQESPQIYRLLQHVYSAQSPGELKESALKLADIDEDDAQAFLIYSSGIYSNMGNYKSFGDSKFVPDLPAEKFESILKASKAWSDNPDVMNKIWASVKDHIWSLTDGEKQLGLGKKGVTKYFSSNCDKTDADRVSTFLSKNKLEAWSTRVIKTIHSDGKPIYEIRSAGVKESAGELVESDNAFFNLTTGDYSPILKIVNEELSEAAKFAANDLEALMLKSYIESFQEGSLEAHKNGSRYWIKDKSPNVETYMGFIEVYRDPVGQRAEFEGFVSMVNKDQSIKFQKLVTHAEELLPLLPWPPTFEKDKFLRPDFTSLDVLAFAGSGIPKGINIPNYGEIRQTEGFKNVHLGNVVSSSLNEKSKSNFVSEQDSQLLKQFREKAFDIQVGLHELLGHGSGKLLSVDIQGKANFNLSETINPITKEPIDPKTIYKTGETYESKFSGLSSAYEECRAESVGLHLISNERVLDIFEVTEDRSDIIYVNWLLLCLSGLGGLEFYSPTSKEWKQAHSRARFAILKVLMEAGQDFITINETIGEDGRPDLLFKMDRSKLESVGKPAISEFLLKLQVYKSLGDIDSAEKLFDHYTTVSNDDPKGSWLEWRDIAISRRKPRKMWIQANTVKKDNDVTIVTYEDTHEGLIQSWVDRFSPKESKIVDEALESLYLRDLPYFQDP